MSSLPSYPSANLVGQSREGHGWIKSRHFMRNKGIPCGRVIGRYRLFLWDLCSGGKGWIGLFFMEIPTSSLRDTVVKEMVWIAGRQSVRHKPLTIEIRKTEYRES